MISLLSPSSRQCREMGNRSCNGFIMLPLWNSFLLILFLCSLLLAAFFMDYSGMLFFNGIQSYRIRLLWCGSPRGSLILPQNLLQHGICFPQAHRRCQDPASVLSMACSFFQGMSTWPTVGVFIGCRWISALLSSSCKGTACLMKVFPPWVAG